MVTSACAISGRALGDTYVYIYIYIYIYIYTHVYVCIHFLCLTISSLHGRKRALSCLDGVIVSLPVSRASHNSALQAAGVRAQEDGRRPLLFGPPFLVDKTCA